jgi:hypothetical protein
MLFLTGVFDSVSVVVRQTIVQLLTPDEMRSRVSAVNNIFIGTSNEFGALESGLTAAFLDPSCRSSPAASGQSLSCWQLQRNGRRRHGEGAERGRGAQPTELDRSAMQNLIGKNWEQRGRTAEQNREEIEREGGENHLLAQDKMDSRRQAVPRAPGHATGQSNFF